MVSKRNRRDQIVAASGCRIVPTYDRSELIKRAIAHAAREADRRKHRRRARLHCFSLARALRAGGDHHAAHRRSSSRSSRCGGSASDSNIMSLGGIAIAIGAMVDSAIIMVENAHKALEHFREEHGREPNNGERCEVIIAAAKSVGRPLFLRAAGHHGQFHSGVLAHRAGRPARSNRSRSQRHFRCSSPRCSAITLVPVLMAAVDPRQNHARDARIR